MLPDDIGRLVEVGAPTLSADGSLVAWTVRRTDLEANRYRTAVWLAPTDGTRPPRQVTAGTDGDGEPRFSPDGRTLAFTSRREGEDDDRRSTLHLLPVDGPGEVVTLTAQPEAVTDLRWSPDGSRLAFTARQRGPRFADGDDDAARPPRAITHLVNRLDGEGFIVDRPSRIWVVPVDGSAPAVAVTGGTGEGDHTSPTWSPDGTRLGFVGHIDEDWDLDQRSAICVAEVGPGPPDGVVARSRLTDGPLAHLLLAWSPDGTRIAGLSEGTAVQPCHLRLTVTDVVTGESTHPAEALDRSHAPFPGARPPVWDGDDVLFPAEDRGVTPVFRVAAEGGAPSVVAGAEGRTVAAWDWAAGTLAMAVTTVDRLAEVHVIGPDGAERRLTHLTDAFHRHCPAHPTERFTVPSPGGEDLDVWLVRPRDLDDSAPHPVLLSIHGGPMTQYGDRWFDEFQLWAGAGFCVVLTNPRGSSGREEAWTQALRSPLAAERPGRGWGADDQADLEAALAGALARYPFLDPDRVGVLGGSYGGFMTSWLVGHTDRFAAACSERAVNNMLTLEAGSDAAGLFRWMIGVDHLTHPEEYLRMSPISSIDAMTTPMLLLHSDEDWRCPVEQADQLHLALRMRGREVEYHRFPGEGHELSRSGSPRHRVQRARLIIDFFRRHLHPSAGPGG